MRIELDFLKVEKGRRIPFLLNTGSTFDIIILSVKWRNVIMEVRTEKSLLRREKECSSRKKEYTGNAFRRISLALLVIGITTIAIQSLLGFWVEVFRKAGVPGLDNHWLLWFLSFLPLYCIAIPLGVLVMKGAPGEDLCKRNFTMYDPETERVLDYKTTKDLGVKDFFSALLVCFPIMYVGNIVGVMLSMLLSGGTAVNPLNEMLEDMDLLMALIPVVVAPVMEEYVFRKQIIDRCGKYGEKTAILFSGLTFGLFHMNLFQFFYAFGLGLLFAYIYTRTGKLRYTVALHMIVNFMGGVVAPWVLMKSGLDLSGEIETSVLAAPSSGMILYMGYALFNLALMIAGIVVFILKVSKLTFYPAPMELQKGTRFKTVYLNIGFILFLIFSLIFFWLNI